jgi:hypothetical protein
MPFYTYNPLAVMTLPTGLKNWKTKAKDRNRIAATDAVFMKGATKHFVFFFLLHSSTVQLWT